MFTGYIEEIENDIKSSVQRVAEDDKLNYEKFKRSCTKIDSSISLMIKKNKFISTDLFDIYNSLKLTEQSLNEIKKENEKVINCLNNVSTANPKIEYNKTDLVNLFTLKHKKLGFTGSNPTLLFKTISEDFDSVLKEALNISDELEKENVPVEMNISSDMEFSLKKSSSFLKAETRQSMLSSHIYSFNRHKTPLFESALLKSKSKKGSSLSNRSIRELNLESAFKENSLGKSNLYRASCVKTEISSNKLSTTPNLKKMNVRELSPSTINYEFSEKNTVITIRNTHVTASSFRNILTDMIGRRKMVEKVVFRDNVFKFNVLDFLKTYFKRTVLKTIKLDLRRNKLKFDSKTLEKSKQVLKKQNIKVII